MSLALDFNCRRKIARIVIHATGGPQDQTIESIKEYWESKNWKNPGYHFIIDKEGEIHQLAKLDTITNGVRGFNRDSLHICYIGGGDKGEDGRYKDNRTPQQRGSIKALLRNLRYQFTTQPIMGHRDLSPDTNKDGIIQFWEWIKECPCFDAKTEYADL